MAKQSAVSFSSCTCNYYGAVRRQTGRKMLLGALAIGSSIPMRRAIHVSPREKCIQVELSTLNEL